MFFGILEKSNKNEKVFINISRSLQSYCCVVISSIKDGSHRVAGFKGVGIE
jgi:hypothetical protein